MKGLWQRLALAADAFWGQFKVRGAERRLHVSAVSQAVERVVDQANPRLRGLMGYRKALFPVVERGLARCEELAASLPGPVRIDRASWTADSLVNVLFADPDSLRRAISGAEVRAWVKANPMAQGDCYGVLLAWPRIRTQLGTELNGETLKRDVQQTTLGFADPDVVLPAEAPEEVRRLAVQGIMDVLVGEAIGALAKRETGIAEIEERLRILRLKRKVLNPAGRGRDFLVEGSGAHVAEEEALTKRIDELEQQLLVANVGLKTLDDYLARLVERLGDAIEHLSVRRERVTLDRMNIVRTAADAAADSGPTGPKEFEFAVGYRGETRGRVLLLVAFPCAEIITADERLADLNRYLTT